MLPRDDKHDAAPNAESSAADAIPKLSVVLALPPKVRQSVSRDWIVWVSTRAMLRHVLYARGIIPAPVDQIMQVYNDFSNKETSFNNANNSRKRPTPMERKFVQCGASLTSTLEDWKLLFDPAVSSMGMISCVLLTVGPSWSRPKEYYVLQFPNLGEDASDVSITCENANSNLEKEHALSRRLVKALLEASMSGDDPEDEMTLAHPSSGASSYQVHITVKVSLETAHRLFEESRDDETSGEPSNADRARPVLQELASSTTKHKWQQLSERLVVRHNFCLDRPKKRRTTNIRNRQPPPPWVELSVTEHGDSQDDPSEADDNRDDGVWMSLRSFVRGFRL